MNVTIETSNLNNGFKIPFGQVHISTILWDLGRWVHTYNSSVGSSYWEYRLYFTYMN